MSELIYLTKVELAKRWRVKTRTIENWVRQEKCPAPVKMSSRRALWAVADIEEHEEAQREAAGMR